MSGCKDPAYFYCNRNRCSVENPEHQRRHKENFALFRGCGNAYCWKHFRFEYFLDRMQYSEPIGDDYLKGTPLEMSEAREIIVNWHCTNGACVRTRYCKSCMCHVAVLSPFLLTLVAFVLSTIIWMAETI